MTKEEIGNFPSLRENQKIKDTLKTLNETTRDLHTLIKETQSLCNHTMEDIHGRPRSSFYGSKGPVIGQRCIHCGFPYNI